MANHIHLDLVGGLSGDMFISSMLDAFPQFKKGLGQVMRLSFELDDLLAAGLNRQEQESVRVQAQRLAIEQVENH